MIGKTAARFLILLAAAFFLACPVFGEEPAAPAAAAAQDTLWIIPQTHWEGAVSKRGRNISKSACRTSSMPCNC